MSQLTMVAAAPVTDARDQAHSASAVNRNPTAPVSSTTPFREAKDCKMSYSYGTSALFRFPER